MASDLVWQNSAAPTDGIIGDLNTMRIDPSHLGMAQDVIIDTSGILRSRGAVISATSDSFANIGIMGVAQTAAGTVLVGFDASGDSYFYGTSATALTGFAKLVSSQYNAGAANSLTINGQLGVWSSTKIPQDRGAIFCNQRATTGNVWPAASFIWGGNATLTSQTPAGTAASTIGSTAIVGVGTAWTSALVNSYLYINNILCGQVSAVPSTTTLSLYKGAYTTVAANTPAFTVARPLMNFVYKGRITTNVASATVVGSNTKWNNAGPAGSGGAYITGFGTSRMYRYRDGAFVGNVTAVVNDTTITLGANAAIALVNEEYYILPTNPGNTTAISLFNTFFGACVEFWAGRFWYGGINAVDPGSPIPSANVFGPYALNSGNGVAFTRKDDPELLDLDPVAGDILTLPLTQNNDQVRALCATRGGLIVFRNNDTFLITGYSPETFRAVKIVEDGCLNAWSFKAYKEGVVWAGTQSMWYFDGTRVVNLLQNKVAHWYKKSKNVISTNPSGLAVSNDHIIYSVNVLSGFNTWPYKNTTKTINVATYVINISNGAVSFFTNLRVLTGFIANTLGSSGPTTPIIIATNTNQQTVASDTSYLLNGDKLIQDSSTAANNFDALTTNATFTSGAQVGPDVMFETTKLTLGDASRLKFWKRFLMNYSSDVAMTGVFIGTNDTTNDFPNISTGTASADSIAVSSNVGIVHRMRFLTRSSTLAIRIYQTATTTATSQRFKCFWWSVGGKRMRQGRPNP